MRAMVALAAVCAVACGFVVPFQGGGRRASVACGGKRGKAQGNKAPRAPAAAESGMSAKAAARLAAEALARPKKGVAGDEGGAGEGGAGGGAASSASKLSAKQKIAARRGGGGGGVEAAGGEVAAPRRKGGSLEMSVEDKAKLRGVAAAEDAYNAAELLADAARGDLGVGEKMDASEVAAAQVYFNATLWPTAVLVGLDLTSRRGAAKLVESRSRGSSGAYASTLAASGSTTWTIDDSLAELERLCETARLRTVGRTSQRLDAANGQYLVGKGKIEDVARLVLEHGADAVVFDDELSLAQQRSVLAELERLGCGPRLQILDRTQLVLQIFSERASTREAKAQIALARAEYMLPRLTTFLTTGAGMESRSGGKGAGGGAYLRGAGESQLEMDRRLFGKRISKLKGELAAIATKRKVTRAKRLDKEDLPLVALIGYTNAGKTSLLNALSDAADTLYADDKLFATLDPATRRVALPSGRSCKLTDTVGFIQKLPTKLVASFRATLEEIADACLLIHVVDASSPLADGQMRAVFAILRELGCFDMPQITVYNKQDVLEHGAGPRNVVVVDAPLENGDENDESDVPSATTVFEDLPPHADEVLVSAATGDGIQPLLDYVDKALGKMNTKVHCLLPFDQGNLVEEIHRTGAVDEVEHLAAGTRVVARVPPSLEQRLRPFAYAANVP